jgi:hypothetical protein
LATVAVVTGQEMGQEAQAKPIPQNWQSSMPVDQVKVNPADESKETVIATPPETLIEPQFATERSLSGLKASSATAMTHEETTEAIEAIEAIAPHEVRAEMASPESSSVATAAMSVTQPVVATQSMPPVEPTTVAQSFPQEQPFTVAQTPRFNYNPPGVSRRRVRTGQLTTVQVTNRAGRPIEIELVGRTRPLLVLPGQTRRLRVDPRDLSLLYWTPGGQQELDATVSQPSLNTLVVNIFPSRFPNGNLAIYLPEPDNRPDILRIF